MAVRGRLGVLLINLLGVGSMLALLGCLRLLLPPVADDHKIFPAHHNASVDELETFRFTLSSVAYKKYASERKEGNSSFALVVVASKRAHGYLTQVSRVVDDSHLRPSATCSKRLVAECPYFCATHTLRPSPSWRLCRFCLSSTSTVRVPFQLNVLYEDGSVPFHGGHYSASTLQKEAADYWRCLDRAFTFFPSQRYVLMLEDDVLAVSSFVLLVSSVVRSLEANPRIAFVKLYHPPRLRKLPFIVQAFSLAALLTFVLWSRFSSPPLLVLLNISLLYLFLHFLSFELFVDLRYWFSGEVYLGMSESCCTQAVLFRSRDLPLLVWMLRGEKVDVGRAKDHILDSSPFLQRQTDSNLVVHIGAASTLRTARVRVDEPRRSLLFR